MTSVADYIVDQLAAWGVERIYGVAGDTVLPLLDAIAHHQAVRYIAVRHEAAAGFMASAEAKLTGRLAACLATGGPGMANLLNGLGDAWADRVPVVAITGQVGSGKIGTMVKQYIDQQLLLQPLAGFSALLASADAADGGGATAADPDRAGLPGFRRSGGAARSRWTGSPGRSAAPCRSATGSPGRCGAWRTPCWQPGWPPPTGPVWRWSAIPGCSRSWASWSPPPSWPPPAGVEVFTAAPVAPTATTS